MRIAALYTCHNRRDKTLASLDSLFDVVSIYNDKHADDLSIKVYLTNDGCTDGTVEGIRESFPERDIVILDGDGNLYWAGGMVLAWNHALKGHNSFDYYLLLNDDTILKSNCIEELFNAIEYSKEEYGIEGIISGITCSTHNVNEVSYGGDIILNKITGKKQRLGVNSKPQMVDITNANILLVPNSVVDKIGIFYNGYIHSGADNDYAMTARKKGIPVLITSGVVGICENDHREKEGTKVKIISMNLHERKAYYYHPLHSIKDYLTFVKRHMPLRYPLSWFFCMMRIYMPKVYFYFNRYR